MSKYLIREFTEFNMQRMNSDSTPMASHVDNPELSSDAYDKNVDIIRQQNVRLNNILHNVFMSSGDFKTADRKAIEDQDFTNFKIERMILEDIRITIYFSLVINEKEYFGVIKNYDTDSPKISCECFRDPELYQNTEWQIRIKGLIIKILNKWMAVDAGEYKALKDVEVFDNKIGTLNKIKSGSLVNVLRSNYEEITVEVGENIYTIKGKNYCYFNYYFDPIDNK